MPSNPAHIGSQLVVAQRYPFLFEPISNGLERVTPRKRLLNFWPQSPNGTGFGAGLVVSPGGKPGAGSFNPWLGWIRVCGLQEKRLYREGGEEGRFGQGKSTPI